MKLKTMIAFLIMLTTVSVQAGVEIIEVSLYENNPETITHYKKLLKRKPNKNIRIAKLSFNQSTESTLSLLSGETATYLSDFKTSSKHSGATTHSDGLRIHSRSSYKESLDILRRGSHIRGAVSINGSEYDIQKTDEPNHVFLVERDLSSMLSENDVMSSSNRSLSRHPSGYSIEPCPIPFAIHSSRPNCDPDDWPGGGDDGGGSNQTPKVRVLFVFANLASDYFLNSNTVMESRAKDAIEDMNDYLATSQVESSMEVEYAGTYRWNYDESYELCIFECEYGDGGVVRTVHRSWSNFLNDSRNNSIVKAKRNQFNADVIAVIVDDELYRYCGMATDIATSASKAYFAVQVDCFHNGLTFAHELGHIMGMRHDPDQDQNTQPYKFGHGYYNTTINQRTIMSYNCANNPSGDSCRRIGVFSNPDVYFPNTSVKAGGYNIQRCGHPRFGRYCDADNARVVEERARAVANFR